MQEVPKDLGRRIVEAARLAVALHLQRAFRLEPQIGGADADGEALTDGGAFAARSANSIARAFAEGEVE
jgi:hypothetical protein